MKKIIYLLMVLLISSGCVPSEASIQTEITQTKEALPTSTNTPKPPTITSFSSNSTDSIEHIPTVDSRLLPEDWQNWPVIPEVSPWLNVIYEQGLADGNDPHAFSKIGDCQSVESFFLRAFDIPPYYRLGEKYSYLMPTIEQFSGSWERKSQAVRGGFNVASVLTAYFTDKEACENTETPLECEFRLNKPSIAIISMETWTSKRPPEVFEGYLRQIDRICIGS